MMKEITDNEKCLEGLIMMGIDGFYYVECDGETYECRARGLFRKQGIKPVAGDRVKFSVSETHGNVVTDVLERTSFLNRPPVANIDTLFIVSSVLEPKPNLLIIDRMTAIALNKGIEPVVVFSKTDLAPADEYIEIYRAAGLESFGVSCVNCEGVDKIKARLSGHISAFSGNSGVGKSSILNAVFPELSLETAQISNKLGRGRHTTRESRLFRTDGGYVADTPGFSSLEFESGDIMVKENVAFGFKEFLPYLGSCKFSTCRHINDKGCKIIEAVENGEIPKTRHESYITLYNEAKSLNEWEIK